MVRGKRDVLAELAQELALAARETPGLAPGHEHEAKDPLLHEQRRNDGRTQSNADEARGQRQPQEFQIGLVHQLAAQAPPQAIGVDIEPSLDGQVQSLCQRLTSVPDTGNAQERLLRLVETDTAEIDWQVVLEAAQNRPEDALQILPFTYRPRDPVQQVEMLELRAQTLLRPFALGDVGGYPENPLHLSGRIA